MRAFGLRKFMQSLGKRGIAPTNDSLRPGSSDSTRAHNFPSASSAKQAGSTSDLRLCLELNFNCGGDGLPWLREGWNTPESDRTWTEGNAASLAFVPPSPGRYVLSLDGSTLGPQRLTIGVNSSAKRHYRFDGNCSATFPVDVGSAQQGLPISIDFELPDAKSPAQLFGGTDTRILAFGLYRLRLLRRPKRARVVPPISVEKIPAATGITLPELLLGFESLGHNCEFGIVQRRCGIEPLGLLRFGGISLDALIRGLREDFEGLGEAGGISHTFWDDGPDREYIVNEKAYALHYHAGITVRQMEPEQLHKRELLRLRFYKRKLLEELEQGDKIFVFQWSGSLLTEEVMPIVESINSKNDNVLLWVVASAEHAPGSVEVLAPNLFRGYVNSLAPLGSVDRDVDLAPWLSVCANAFRIRKRNNRVRYPYLRGSERRQSG